MKSNPLVSVILPCYNASKYIEQAIYSIMNQSYKNLEIIVTDDCSTDSTLEKIRKLAAQDSRIIVMENTQNIKLVKCLNAMIQVASGKYIVRMDADDVSMTERIEKQIAFLESHPDIDLCGTNAFHIDSNGKKIGKSFLPQTFNEIRFFMPFYCSIYHPTVAARIEVLKENPYSESFIHAEDYELWCRLLYVKGFRIENLQDRLLYYRISDKQISSMYRSVQNESSASIFRTHSIICRTKVNEHISVFFTHTGSNDKKDYEYTLNCLVSARKYKKSISTVLYTKIVFHFWTHKYFNSLFFLIRYPMCLKSFFTLAIKNISGCKR